MSRSTDITLAFIFGAIAGGAIALLMAPEKGEVTRMKIRRGATDLVDKGKGWVSETTDGVRGRATGVVDRVRGKASDVTETARMQIDSVKGAIAEGKEAYRREMDRPRPPEA